MYLKLCCSSSQNHAPTIWIADKLLSEAFWNFRDGETHGIQRMGEQLFRVQ